MFPLRGLNITSKPIHPALQILRSRAFFNVSCAARVPSVVCLNNLRIKSECETTETEACDEFFNSFQNCFVRSSTKEEDESLSSAEIHHLSLTSRESTSKYSEHFVSLKMSTMSCMRWVSATLSNFSFSDALLKILVSPHSRPTESRPPTDLISRHALENRKSTLGHIWSSCLSSIVFAIGLPLMFMPSISMRGGKSKCFAIDDDDGDAAPRAPLFLFCTSAFRFIVAGCFSNKIIAVCTALVNGDTIT
mmetsp:Transcript_4318/g.13250  ORF Transcript_4318/g.13250 Transcript_4318/m.13250 type:complete len:249 (-) Transcript_4318:1162-1908(-)